MFVKPNTIAAKATADGTGGIAVVRVSGENAFDIAEKVFIPAGGGKLSDLPPNTACYGCVFDDGEKIDDGIITLFHAPKSYTGENVAEISCHGGIYVTGRVLGACINAGARTAEAGEFTKKALLNGKLSLTEAESVTDIIYSQNRQYLAYSLAQKDGALYKKLEKISRSVLDIVTQITAWIDYPEEDLDSFEISSQLGQLTECRLQLHLLIESYEVGKLLREGVCTAIVGKPNVGKSTIMNLLLGTERCIVTDIAGTTRDIIEESVNVNGAVLKLSDCAGLRDTNDIIEEIGVALMYRKLEEAGLVLAVFDNSRPLEKDDYTLLEKIKGKNAICVINKADLENKLDFTFLATQFGNVVEISAKDPSSFEPLATVINKVLQLNRLDMTAGFIANERQRECAARAEKALAQAIEGIGSGVTLDATGVMLEEALGCLYELSGKKVSETVIDEVFKRFCVGK